MKKFIILICSLLLTITLSSCKSGHDEKIPEGKTPLSIYYFKGGYGEKFLQDMKVAYENYNKKAYIILKPYSSMQASSVVSSIESGTVQYDLYFLNSTGMNLAAGGYLEPLDDVYKGEASASTLTVEDKMLDYYQEYFDMSGVDTVDGSYYAMPWATGYCGLLYNKTTLDSVYGDGQYVLPRTTNELTSLSDDLILKGLYPFVWSTETEYWTFMFTIWWAQYEGLESFKRYFNAEYVNDSGEVALALNGESLMQKGREESFKLLAKYMEKQNGYSHQYADSMSFVQAQSAFFGRGFGQIDSKLCAFMVNGDWADSEMKESAGKYQQEVNFMRPPVISALGEKLGISEEKLVEVVDYVDGLLDGKTLEPIEINSTTGYSKDEVINSVKEARSMVYDLGRHHNIVLPKNPKRSEEVTELAKDFLKFFASDFASRIYVEALEGLNLPYGYEVKDTTKFSGFVKSMYTAFPSPVPVSYYKTTPLTFAGNVYITPAYKLETYIFPSTVDYIELGKKMYNDTITRYTVDRNWTTILEQSGYIK